MKSLALAVLALGAAACAQPQAHAPETADRVQDRAEVIAVVDGIDHAVDARDWPRATALFTPRIGVDFKSLSGQPPAEMAAADLTAAWDANLRGKRRVFTSAPTT